MEPTSRTRGTREPELPELDAGIRLLEVAGDEPPTGPLHSLVLDHLLLHEGGARWVDAGGHAVAQSLASLAPTTRPLDRIRVARGFTAQQHYALVRRLRDRVDDETALLVCPDLDRPYRDAEAYADESEDLLLRAVATLAGLANRRDVPVLVARSTADEFSAPIEAAAAETLRCERTRFGPRFVGDEFETQVYPTADGTVQTTLALWRRVLAARAGLAETAEASHDETWCSRPEGDGTTAGPVPEVTARGAH